MSSDLDKLSKDELLEVIYELQSQLSEKESEVAQLSGEIELLHIETKSNRKSTIESLDVGETNSVSLAEIEELKDQLEKEQNKVNELNDQINELKAKKDVLFQQKSDSEARNKKLLQEIQDLKKELKEVTSKNKSVDKQNEEFKKDTIQQAKILFEENRRLQEENISLNDKIKTLQDDRDQLSGRKAELELHKESLEAHVENHDIEKELLQDRLKSLETELDDLQEKLQIAQHAEIEWENEVALLKKDFEEKVIISNEKVKSLIKEIEEYKREISHLQDTTLIGEKDLQLKQMTNDYNDSLDLINELRGVLERVSEERDQLKDHMESVISARIVKEIGKGKLNESKLESLEIKLKEEKEMYAILERQTLSKEREIEELNNEINVLKSSFPYKDLFERQNKLRDENIRLGLAIEEMSHQMGILSDNNAILSQNFEKLKLECGKPIDFAYPLDIIEKEISDSKARLEAQVKQLEDQVNNLEKENINLRKTLKNQAGSIGEQGFKYAGMTPEMLVQVNEFATNLRENRIELPYNDKSKELLEEIKLLKHENKILLGKVSELEKRSSNEWISSGETINMKNDQFGNLADMTSIKNDIQQIIYENNELKEKISRMQRDVINVLKHKVNESAENGIDSRDQIATDTISALLIEHNDSLMKEIRQLHDNQRQLQLHNDFSSVSMSRPNKIPSTAFKTSYKLPVDSHADPIINSDTYLTPNYKYSNTPFSNSNNQKNADLKGPLTPFGKTLLKNNINQLNLPDDEWANDVKDLNVQLIECLEQLYDKEEELENNKQIIQSFEDHLLNVKKQITILYYNYNNHFNSWTSKENNYKDLISDLSNQNTDLNTKIKHLSEVVEFKSNHVLPEEFNSKISDLSRKLMIYEINEKVLTRKYIAQAELLNNELNAKKQLEKDFIEMEISLKKRILYLESFKLYITTQIARIQQKLENSVPQSDYLIIYNELDFLRNEHIGILTLEAENQTSALINSNNVQLINQLSLEIINYKSKVENLTLSVEKLKSELKNQIELNSKSLHSSEIIGELAKYRGESARLEVEYSACKHKCDLLVNHNNSISTDNNNLINSVNELKQNESLILRKEQELLTELSNYKVKYENGLSKAEADRLLNENSSLRNKIDELTINCDYQKELATITTLQNESLQINKDNYITEINSLREYVIQLESRSDDDLIIGQLQRKYSNMKKSYQLYVRKYNVLRNNMRQRELAIRLLEARLDQREEVVLSVQDNHRNDVLALKKALILVNQTVVDDLETIEDLTANINDASSKDITRANLILNKSKKLIQNGRYTDIPKKILQISKIINNLCKYINTSVRHCYDIENNNKLLLNQLEILKTEKVLLEHKLNDINEFMKSSSGESKQQIVRQLNKLYDEINEFKLSNFQLNRQITNLQSEKHYLLDVVNKISANVELLEQNQVRLESQNIFHSLSNQLDNSPVVLRNEVSSNVKELDNKDGDVGSFLKTVHAFVESEDKIISPNLADQVKSLNNLLESKEKELLDYKLKYENILSNIELLEINKRELNHQISYYEKLAESENLPLLNKDKINLPQNNKKVKSSNLLQHSEQLQLVTTETINSLKLIIEEKNRMIDKLRKRVEELSIESSKRKTRADRNAEDLLDRLDKDEVKSDNKVSISDNIEGIKTQQLLDQIDEASTIIHDKNMIINQLEQKLLLQVNARERAEVRCGDSIKEMNAMKFDMTYLTQQLTSLQNKYNQLRDDSNDNRKNRRSISPTKQVSPLNSIKDSDVRADDKDKRINDLIKANKSKEAKIINYRDVIIKLKNEFIKLEEEKSLFIATNNKSSNSSQSRQISVEEISELKAQVSTLKNGLLQAKEDLIKANKTQEKLLKSKDILTDSNNNLDNQIRSLQSQLSMLENVNTKLKHDLEESKLKEFKLKDKIKDINNNQEKKISEFDKNYVELLKAQNEALRKGIIEGMPDPNLPIPPSSNAIQPKSSSYILGTGEKILPDGKEGSLEEIRHQLHNKWENEKKLQKRIVILEKRLEEKLNEIDSLQNQLQKVKENQTKEENQKKVNQTVKPIKELKTNSAEERISLSSKKEIEQEILISQLEKIIKKQQSDIERMNSKGNTTSNLNMNSEYDKKLTVERKKNEKLNEEVINLTNKLKNHEELNLKLTQRQQLISSLRKQIKLKDDEIVNFKSTISDLHNDINDYNSRISKCEEIIKQLNLTKQQLSNELLLVKNNKEDLNVGGKVDKHLIEKFTDDIKNLNEIIKQKDNEIIQLQSKQKSQSSNNQSDYKTIIEENNKLKQELAAFDLDFFEEIENMKYEYAEALKKIRIYKRAYGDI